MAREDEDNKAESAKLLVSVRSVAEAEAAIDGGADIIDIKEPNHGSLGAASLDVIRLIIHAVGGRKPVTAALGELVDWNSQNVIPMGLHAVKFGLAGARDEDWQEKLSCITKLLPKGTSLVAVAYADHQKANSPTIEEVSEFAIRTNVPYFLLDTFDKSHGSLLEHLPVNLVIRLVKQLKEHDIQTVVAGGLHLNEIQRLVLTSPAAFGFRTAVCEGGRQGVVSKQLVEALQTDLKALNRAANDALPT